MSSIDFGLMWGYDIETYPDIFTCAFQNVKTGEQRFFEMSDEKNDHAEFCEFVYSLASSGCSMVGYNNIGFDYPIIHKIIKNNLTLALDAFYLCDHIINSGDRFSHLVWENDHIVPQIDLYKIHHFDNAARSTSLKVLEFNMRSHNIKDLPFPVGLAVGIENYPTLREYNNHDVSETIKFFHHTVKALKMRRELSLKYNKDFTNHNDTKIGKDYFIMQLGDGLCYFKDQNNRRQPRQTIRQSIDLKSVIFNYINFDSRQFSGILNYFKSQVIHETKGVFNNVLMTPDQALCADPESVKVSGISPILIKTAIHGDQHVTDKQILKEKRALRSAISANRPVKLSMVIKHMIDPPYYDFKYIAKNLNCMINGFGYDFGVGGIHGSGKTVASDQEFMILDIDVASYYPNVAIHNRLYPDHLGSTFCDIYSDVYNQRKQTIKGSPENAMFKLALNGVYGDSNNVYSPFYDPAYTMAITINGQLLLCLLVEKLIADPSVEMIQINTDGLTIKMPRSLKTWVDGVCDWWQSVTKLDLEFAEYSRFFIRDVNNYIAEYPDGSLKRKGCYAHDRDNIAELPWHKNHSGLVIAKAAEFSLIKGGDPAEFIRGHSDHMDFMKRAKVPRSSRLVGVGRDGVDHPLDNITRYYVTTDPRGVDLVKIMPPLSKNPEIERRIGIDVGCKVAPCNNLDDLTMAIDFDHYVKQALKLIEPVK